MNLSFFFFTSLTQMFGIDGGGFKEHLTGQSRTYIFFLQYISPHSRPRERRLMQTYIASSFSLPRPFDGAGG
jgi:hypothetical protein